MAEPMDISKIKVKRGPSTWIVWAGAILSVAIAVIDAVKGDSTNAIWLAGISAGLVAINNIVRSWQATAATRAGADVAAASMAEAPFEKSQMPTLDRPVANGEVVRPSS